MAFPEPVPGLVIRYSYLWRREHLEGGDEGQKDRPCAIIAAIRTAIDGSPRVLVLPVTHSPSAHPALAVEIPVSVKRRLGLDDARSWIIVSEWNEFVWPGPDLRRIDGPDGPSISYGMLPPGLFATVRDKFLDRVTRKMSDKVVRD